MCIHGRSPTLGDNKSHNLCRTLPLLAPLWHPRSWCAARWQHASRRAGRRRNISAIRRRARCHSASRIQSRSPSWWGDVELNWRTTASRRRMACFTTQTSGGPKWVQKSTSSLLNRCAYWTNDLWMRKFQVSMSFFAGLYVNKHFFLRCSSLLFKQAHFGDRMSNSLGRHRPLLLHELSTFSQLTLALRSLLPRLMSYWYCGSYQRVDDGPVLLVLLLKYLHS